MRVPSVIAACLLLVPAIADISQFERSLQNAGSTVASGASSSISTAMSSLGHAYTAFPSVSTSSDPSSTCTMSAAETGAAARFISDSGSAVGSGLIGSLGRALTQAASSSSMAFNIQADMQASFSSAQIDAEQILGFSGGHGAGFGVEAYCNGELVFAFGGGGGIGMTPSEGGFGGGGGAQSSSVDVGGGVGCSTFGAISNCHNQGDAGGVGFNTLSAAIRSKIDACPSLTVCVEGGGGGGFSIASPSGGTCHYGGGYSISFTTFMIKSSNGVREVVPLNSTDACGAQPGRYDRGISTAANVCSTSCAGQSNFYQGCYCPCFKGKVEGMGLKWGFSMSCSGSAD